MTILHFCSSNRHNALTLVNAYAGGFSDHLLSVLDSIEEEANRAGEEYFQRRMQEPGWDGGPDEGDIAEAATDHGLGVYEDLAFVRQQLVQLAVAGLYHLWERILKEFIIREFSGQVSPPSPPEDVRNHNFHRLVELLSLFGWAVRDEDFFADLNLLRHIANTVKHGDGSSCEELAELAPDLFHEAFPGMPLRMPLRARDLSLSADDFQRFVISVRTFFERFPGRLEYSSPST